MPIQFNKPYICGKELEYIRKALDKGHISGDGSFSHKCHKWLEEHTLCLKALLTHSCTAALEMAAILADIKAGDEIIMPSYSFVSTANAFVMRGGIPVFIDIRPDTMNLDESIIEEAITSKTKAIVPVHYAGVACEMDKIMDIADKYRLLVIEDAAQGILSKYNRKTLGSIGHLGALSFHESKNITCGEGGALLINDSRFIERAEIIREKGTNRSKYFRDEVDKYSWVDIGSSYLPSDILAAILYAQLENAAEITAKRMEIWEKYFNALKPLAAEKLIKLPFIPNNCTHNAHLFYFMTKNLSERTTLMHYLMEKGIHSAFHYIPLHSSAAGLNSSIYFGKDRFTTQASETLIRLPLYVGLTKEEIDRITDHIVKFYDR